MSRLPAALAAVLVLALPGAARAATIPKAKLRSALATSRLDEGIPAASAAIVRDGRVVWSAAVGRAVDTDGVHPRTGRPTARRNRPARVTTRFSLASASKTYTAALVLKLVDEGKVVLDEPLARWAPAIPGADRVTVRMLLDHTTGYPDVETESPLAEQLDIGGGYDPNQAWNRAEILSRQQAPRFPPGSKYEYSNSNYLLLGEVLERASGGNADSELQRLIAGPLGLRETTYATRPGLAAKMARSYEYSDETYNDHWAGASGVPTDLVGPVWTDGGVVTTAREAARFFDALNQGRLLSPATQQAMLTPSAPGAGERYGLGTYAYGEAGRTWQGHDGNYGGYQSQVFTDRAGRLTLAVLVNSDGDSAETVFSALAKVLAPR
ncbi:MAG: beta-lactamase family protein [Solirubrobacteraceae bacterium]|nr:beta-lactamase family protein [Solirubrobacteraceae bacterium]